MPLAVAHVILTVVIIDIYRDYISKKKFPLFFVLLAGFGGLIPDIDLLFEWLGVFFVHGDFHLILVPLVLFLLSFVIYRVYNRKNYFMYPLFLGMGYLFHIFLDSLIGNGYNQVFYPFSSVKLGLNLIPPQYLIGLDAVILLAWLFHEYRQHNIKDFI